MSKIIIVIAATSLTVIAHPPATAQPSQSKVDQTSTSTPFAQLRMDAVPRLDNGSIQQVQYALQAKGFDPGPIDGILGPKTKDALTRFQDRYGIGAEGEINNQTLLALGRPDLAGEAGTATPPAR